MIGSLAAFAALLLGLCVPPAPSLPSLGLLLAVLTVLPVAASGWTPYGLLGLPGDWAETRGGRAP